MAPDDQQAKEERMRAATSVTAGVLAIGLLALVLFMIRAPERVATLGGGDIIDDDTRVLPPAQDVAIEHQTFDSNDVPQSLSSDRRAPVTFVGRVVDARQQP